MLIKCTHCITGTIMFNVVREGFNEKNGNFPTGSKAKGLNHEKCKKIRFNPYFSDPSLLNSQTVLDFL